MSEAAVSTTMRPGPRCDARRRPVRVLALLAAVVLLSLGDLSMTLTHVRSAGMYEGNPLARHVINLNSPSALAAWKLATLVLAVGILFRVRHTRAGELGAWACVAVLTWLTLRWVDYSDEVSSLDPAATTGSDGNDPRWVVMAPEGP